MNSMKLEREEIFFINALDEATGVIAKDCIVGKNIITFLVKSPDMGRAIGAKGENTKNLSKKLNRKVEVVGFYDDPKEFFEKAMQGVEVKEVIVRENSLVVKVNSTDKREILIDGGKFKRIKKLAERNYSVDSVKLR